MELVMGLLFLGYKCGLMIYLAITVAVIKDIMGTRYGQKIR